MLRSRYSHCDFHNLLAVGGHYQSEVVTGKDSQPAEAAPVYAMPYEMDGGRGILIVNKKATSVEVTIAGVKGGQATAVEVNTDPSCSEPGWEPQVPPPRHHYGDRDPELAEIYLPF
eukprot:COSAG01_NODE_1275_length_10938_cov_100.784482_11_plen_116_part_00